MTPELKGKLGGGCDLVFCLGFVLLFGCFVVVLFFRFETRSAGYPFRRLLFSFHPFFNFFFFFVCFFLVFFFFFFPLRGENNRGRKRGKKQTRETATEV